MRILFTGGTGFIGRHYINRYPLCEYTVLTRRPARAARILPADVKFIKSLDELSDLDDFDAVINLCGEPIADKRWTSRQKQAICDSRWQPTARLVELFRTSSKPPRVFISGSAIGFYGDTGNRKTTEADAPNNQDFAYAVCDRWEALARGSESLTRLVLLRTGVVLGKDDGALSKMLPPFRLGLGGRIGSGQQYMSWIHIADMIGAMHMLLSKDSARGVYNMTAPEAVPNDHFCNTLADTLGTRARLPLPEVMLRTLMGESADLLLNSQRIYPKRLRALGYDFRFPDLASALQDLLGSD